MLSVSYLTVRAFVVDFRLEPHSEGTEFFVVSSIIIIALLAMLACLHNVY